MGIRIEAATDLGLKRAQNEDSHGIWIPEDESRRARRGVLLVVADGMGGSRAGEVASRLAVETVLGVFRSSEEEDVAAVLRHAVTEANRVVHHESLTHPELQGMGTTCTVVAVRGTEAWLAHVGDSRAYLVRRGSIEQVTRDHSLVAQLVRDNQLTPEEARATVVAYEPVWAIGTGKVATVEQASEAHRIVRATLERVVGPGIGEALAILYGGSVNAGNAAGLFADPQLDGALVGGASLEAAPFWRIVGAAS